MFSTTWSKRGSKVLFAAAMTGLLWLWPGEGKPAGKPKPPTPSYTVQVLGPEVMGLGTDFKYSLSTSPPGWEVESLADGSPVPLIFGGEIAEDMATLGCGEPIPGEPSMRQLTGTVVIQHNRSQYPYNRWTTFHFYWKRPDLKLSYSLRIYGQPPDPEGAFLKACTIDFTTNPDPEIPTPTPGAPYHLVEIRGGRTTADLEGVTYFTVQTYPTQ